MYGSMKRDVVTTKIKSPPQTPQPIVQNIVTNNYYGHNSQQTPVNLQLIKESQDQILFDNSSPSGVTMLTTLMRGS